MDWGQTISHKYRKHRIDFYDRQTHKFVIKYRVPQSLARSLYFQTFPLYFYKTLFFFFSFF